ncbi:MAG: hypothetical protein OEY89_16305 [Gammaproteobacteria bacterium]|nr:hypothetical protein [Gammaproteobacteria bacterium]
MKNKLIDELNHIGSMLNKYKHQYGESVRKNKEVSARMYKWIDRYNTIKEKHDQEWVAYCEAGNYCETHDAYDCLA